MKEYEIKDERLNKIGNQIKTSKEFKTHEDQLKILNEKGVKTDEDSLNILKRNNYYFLINRYKDLFLKSFKKPTIYKEGTHFNEFVAIYEFDRDLRDLILEYSIQIENTIKSILSYEFSKKFSHQYLCKECFDDLSNEPKRVKEINDLFSTISSTITRGINERKYLKHYSDKYLEIPLWVIINDLSLGSTSKFYSLMYKEDKQIIANYFNLTFFELDKYLKVITYFRNLAAHNQRIFDESCNVVIEKTSLHNSNQYNKNHLSTVYTIMIIFEIMLERKDFKECIRKFTKISNVLENNIHTISLKDVENMMNLPHNYAKDKWNLFFKK